MNIYFSFIIKLFSLTVEALWIPFTFHVLVRQNLGKPAFHVYNMVYINVLDIFL